MVPIEETVGKMFVVAPLTRICYLLYTVLFKVQSKAVERRDFYKMKIFKIYFFDSSVSIVKLKACTLEVNW